MGKPVTDTSHDCRLRQLLRDALIPAKSKDNAELSGETLEQCTSAADGISR
jgi:hypothetical protein